MDTDFIELDLIDLGKIKAVRFDKAIGHYNMMYLDEEGERFVKLTMLEFDEPTAKKLLRELIYYHKFLSDINVKVPKNYYLGIHEGTHILEIDDYIPETFKEAVDKYGIEKTVDLLFEDIFIPLLKSTKEDYLECGIDTPLRNFQYKDDHAYYVDFFLPRIFFGFNDTVLEIPENDDPKDRIVGIFNKYEKKGVLYSLFINLCREYPKERELFKRKCLEAVEKIGERELGEYIEKSVVEELFSQDKEKKQKFIEGLTFENEEYFIARDFACYLAKENERFAAIMEDFFKATNNSAGNGFYVQDRINNAKNILLENI